jgi:hypothetical protein
LVNPQTSPSLLILIFPTVKYQPLSHSIVSTEHSRSNDFLSSE